MTRKNIIVHERSCRWFHLVTQNMALERKMAVSNSSHCTGAFDALIHSFFLLIKALKCYIIVLCSLVTPFKCRQISLWWNPRADPIRFTLQGICSRAIMRHHKYKTWTWLVVITLSYITPFRILDTNWRCITKNSQTALTSSFDLSPSKRAWN